jgi:hypothetical protein
VNSRGPLDIWRARWQRPGMKLMLIGFPKSGTTTITRALETSGLKVAHWVDDGRRFIGGLIYDGLFRARDPFAHLKDYDAITQADVCLPAQGINWWPNLDFAMLRAIRREHPTCLLVLNYRKPEAVCDSIIQWNDLQKRVEMAEIPGLPAGRGGKRGELITWIENHFDACRNYFSGDDRFLEIDIESAAAPILLSEALNMTITHWGDFKPEGPSVEGSQLEVVNIPIRVKATGQ